MSRFKLVLASASKDRKLLLQQIGIRPSEIYATHIDETVAVGELPRLYAVRMAREKALTALAGFPDSFIIAADTVVCCGRRFLLSAGHREDVIRYLTLLSGRRHRVYTAVSVINPQGKMCIKSVETMVMFKRLSQQEIDAYGYSDEGINRAGGYAIQGKAAMFVKRINGSYSSVVGLPLMETKNMLIGLGYEI